jgi:hypothetical protein
MQHVWVYFGAATEQATDSDKTHALSALSKGMNRLRQVRR